MDERNQIYFYESYVPAWIAADDGFRKALSDRAVQLVEKDDYEVVLFGAAFLDGETGVYGKYGEAYIRDTPNAPPPPGLVTLRVVLLVREFDSLVGDDDFDEDDAEVAAMNPPPGEGAGEDESGEWAPEKVQ